MISVQETEKLYITINIHDVTLETSTGLLNAMKTAMKSECKNIIIDFRAVSMIDSSGISMLVKFVQLYGTSDRKISLVNVSSSIKTIMEMVNLTHFFRIL